MKLKLIILTAVLCLTTVSCSEKKENSYSSNEVSVNSSVDSVVTDNDNNHNIDLPESRAVMKEKYKDVPEVSEGAVISVSNTTAKAGEIAEVTVSLEGKDVKWNMCGMHLAYPEELKCIYPEDEEIMLEFEQGEAVKRNTGLIVMEWKKENNPPAELVNKKLGSLFFTVTFNKDDGKDGDILTVYFKVPENAKSGTVYPIDFYYMESDIFRNLDNDPSFEKYAFEHTQAGSITVE
ncbi:MAG: hypothetical protein K2K02_04405 [Ruminococcus sp.]|nr:hypothetical protein [Ruminococcus sp.]